MGTHRVILPNRNSEGWLIGTKGLITEDTCPVCGSKTTTKLNNYCEDGEYYSVHNIHCPNGCEFKYSDLDYIT